MEQRECVNYFAYGSNLLTARLRIGVRSAKNARVGRLDGYKLMFRKYSPWWKGGTADIVPEKNSIVMGIVWQIDESDVAILDKQEIGYRAITVDVNVGDKMIECRTYVQIEKGEPTEPSFAYKSVMLRGAAEHNLNPQYIEHIQKMPDNGVEQCELSQLIRE